MPTFYCRNLIISLNGFGSVAKKINPAFSVKTSPGTGSNSYRCISDATLKGKVVFAKDSPTQILLPAEKGK